MSGPPDDVAIVGGGQEPTSVNRVLSLVVSLAGRLLGYRPEVGIEEGLRRTTAWFVGNLGGPEP